MPRDRRGRPRNERADDERVPLSIRVRGNLFNRLDHAATDSDWALGREVEYRLEQTFLRDEVKRDLVDEVLRLRFGAQLGGLLNFLGEHMLSTATDTAFAKNANVWRQLLADRQVFKPAADFAAAFLSGMVELVPGSNNPVEGAGNEGDALSPGQQHARDLLAGLAGERPFDVMVQPVRALLDAAAAEGAA